MVARSTDGHKTNASLGAELLDGDWDGDAKRLKSIKKSDIENVYSSARVARLTSISRCKNTKLSKNSICFLLEYAKDKAVMRRMDYHAR